MRRTLRPGEAVRLDARPHGAALARPLARAATLASLGGALVAFGLPRAWPLGVVGAVALAFAALGALRAVLAWDRTRLVVTSARLVVVHGVLLRRTAAAELPPGGAFEVEQGILGRILGYGTVVAGDLEVPYVPRPDELSRAGRF